MVEVGTNADEANTKIARNGKDAAWAVSALVVERPMKANIQVMENPNRSKSARPPTNVSGSVWILNPTAKPTPVMSVITHILRVKSARARPPSTAERDIGKERKRSSSPLRRSSESPTAVFTHPNTTVCTKMPGIKKST